MSCGVSLSARLADLTLTFPRSSPPPSEAQLEQNARNRRPSLSPIVLRQMEQEQKAKTAATIDITQVMSKLSKQGRVVPPPGPPPAPPPAAAANS